MRARIVRDAARRALFTALGGSAVAFLMLSSLTRWGEDLWYWLTQRWYPPDGAVIATALALAIAAIAPWVVLYAKGAAHEVVVSRQNLRVGPLDVPASRITGLSVATDGHGASLAVGTGDDVTFLEVDRLDDTRPVFAALGKLFPGEGVVRARLARRSLVFVIGVVAAVQIVFSALVILSLGSGASARDIHGGLVLTQLPLVLLVGALAAMRATPMNVAWGMKTTTPTRALDRSPLERHTRAHLERALTSDPAPPRVRVELLARGDEASAPWLARIDTMVAGDVYRGDPLPKDGLWEVLGDDTCAVDVRVAAARLLARVHREPREAIEKAAADPDVRSRIGSVLDGEAEDAADRLDAVGPLFRNRA